MEVALAVFGLLAAVAMIWMARKRHRGGGEGSRSNGRAPHNHRATLGDGAADGGGGGGGNGGGD